MKKRFSPKKTAAFCTVSVLLALIIWTVWGNTALMVSTAAISSSRIPPAFSGFRIAQVSDFHNAEFGKDNSTLLRMLSESGPDIIVITGDLVDSTHTDIDTALSFAKEAVQIAPVYYVTPESVKFNPIKIPLISHFTRISAILKPQISSPIG